MNVCMYNYMYANKQTRQSPVGKKVQWPGVLVFENFPEGIMISEYVPQRYNWPRRPAGGNKPNLRVFSFSDAFRLPINVCD